MRDLRSKRGPLATIVNYNVREIVARSIGTRVARSFHLTIVDINLTDLGDILLAVTLPAQVTTRPNSELMKLSPAGDILWRVNCWLLNIDIDSQKWPHDFNAVVCDDIIYTVEQSTSDNMAFTLRKLSDGSVISRKTLSKPAVVFPFDHVEFWSTCRTLSLFDNENKAMVIFPDRCCMSIIDVATGYDDKVSYCCGFDGLLCYRWRRTKVGQGSVSQEHSIMEDLTNPWSTQLLWLDTNYVIEDPLEPLQCFYDPSRELLFEMWTTFFPSHRFLGFFVTPATYGQTCYCGDETVEPKKSQSSTEEYRVAKYLVDIENERVRVTLPQQRIWSTVALEKQSKRGAREPIVKQLLTEPEQMSFFGLFGDYLVCHRLDETTLTILDFWPDW